MTGDRCQVPPEGWYCTRRPGHEGPCAALPVVDVENPNETVSSFPVSRREAIQAKIWMEKHDKEKHAKAFKHGQRYAGAIGGAYSWKFTGTSIGVSTVVVCSCGEELDVTNYDLW